MEDNLGHKGISPRIVPPRSRTPDTKGVPLHSARCISHSMNVSISHSMLSLIYIHNGIALAEDPDTSQ